MMMASTLLGKSAYCKKNTNVVALWHTVNAFLSDQYYQYGRRNYYRTKYNVPNFDI